MYPVDHCGEGTARGTVVFPTTTLRMELNELSHFTYSELTEQSRLI